MSKLWFARPAPRRGDPLKLRTPALDAKIGRDEQDRKDRWEQQKQDTAKAYLAGVTLERSYNLDAPQGVRGRNSDNTLLRETVGWEPEISLEEGSRSPTPGSRSR